MRQRNILQENPVFLEDELLPFGELVVLCAERIGCKPCAIGLVGGKAFDVVDAIGGRGRAFMRAEIADQVGAVARDRLTPVAGIGGEFLPLERVDLVADEAGDHRCSPLVSMIRFATLNALDASVSIEV